MTDDNTDNPYAPPMPVEEESRKPIVARRWCHAMLVVGVIPVLLAVMTFVFLAMFGEEYYKTWPHTSRIQNDHTIVCIILLELTCASSFFGLLTSFVALIISCWWRWKLIFPSLILKACNFLLFTYIFWMHVLI